jgi:2-succinyl-5-enolpyruvyl-6-hydroxy-3-cyclohexene-1-carboxylate synthase
MITIGGQTGDYPLFHKLADSKIKYEHWRISPAGDVVDTYDHLTRIYECIKNLFSLQ